MAREAGLRGHRWQGLRAIEVFETEPEMRGRLRRLGAGLPAGRLGAGLPVVSSFAEARKGIEEEEFVR